MSDDPLNWRDALNLDPQIKLVVCDMDGTLLDGDSRLPEEFWPLFERMQRTGVTFVPASGRQYATLKREFISSGEDSMDFIAENGNVLVHGGELLWTTRLPDQLARNVIGAARDAMSRGRNLGLVLCGADMAYIERTDPVFEREVRRYYAAMESVDNLDEVVDQGFVKLAVYDLEDAATGAKTVFTEEALGYPVKDFAPVVSGQHWIDVMDTSVNKGIALDRLQKSMGVTPAQTAVFGDYLNDLQMMSKAEFSFAMSNAHPEIKSISNYIAPTNVEHGVLQILDELLAR